MSELILTSGIESSALCNHDLAPETEEKAFAAYSVPARVTPVAIQSAVRSLRGLRPLQDDIMMTSDDIASDYIMMGELVRKNIHA